MPRTQSIAINPDTVVLDRNSYDLVRSPIREVVNGSSDQRVARKTEAEKLGGDWGVDLGIMAAIKVLQGLGLRERRFTTGQIAESIRDDEDYMEVLKIGSFSCSDLQEVRMSATDAAHDALTGDRIASSPAPRLESLIWRQRRRYAEIELRRKGVTVRVVTTSGRTRN